MVREDIQLKFRVPADVRERLDQAAAENGRSLSAEILDRLMRSFQADDGSRELERRVSELEDRLTKNEELTRSIFRPRIRAQIPKGGFRGYGAKPSLDGEGQ